MDFAQNNSGPVSPEFSHLIIQFIWDRCSFYLPITRSSISITAPAYIAIMTDKIIPVIMANLLLSFSPDACLLVCKALVSFVIYIVVADI